MSHTPQYTFEKIEYPKYFYNSTDHKVICLRDCQTMIIYQCKKFHEKNEEHLAYTKTTMPTIERLNSFLEGFTECDFKKYKEVIVDYFAKNKEYRDLFATIDKR